MQFLLIEDDEIDAEAFTRGFYQYLSYPLHVVLDGDKALTLLCGHDNQAPLQWPYVIVLDLDLPRLNGLKFLQTIRQNPNLRHSAVFVLTDSNYEVHKNMAYQHGIVGYILKENLRKDSQSLFTLLDLYCRLNSFP